MMMSHALYTTLTRDQLKSNEMTTEKHLTVQLKRDLKKKLYRCGFCFKHVPTSNVSSHLQSHSSHCKNYLFDNATNTLIPLDRFNGNSVSIEHKGLTEQTSTQTGYNLPSTANQSPFNSSLESRNQQLRCELDPQLETVSSLKRKPESPHKLPQHVKKTKKPYAATEVVNESNENWSGGVSNHSFTDYCQTEEPINGDPFKVGERITSVRLPYLKNGIQHGMYVCSVIVDQFISLDKNELKNENGFVPTENPKQLVRLDTLPENIFTTELDNVSDNLNCEDGISGNSYVAKPIQPKLNASMNCIKTRSESTVEKKKDTDIIPEIDTTIEESFKSNVDEDISEKAETEYDKKIKETEKKIMERKRKKALRDRRWRMRNWDQYTQGKLRAEKKRKAELEKKRKRYSFYGWNDVEITKLFQNELKKSLQSKVTENSALAKYLDIIPKPHLIQEEMHTNDIDFDDDKLIQIEAELSANKTKETKEDGQDDIAHKSNPILKQKDEKNISNTGFKNNALKEMTQNENGNKSPIKCENETISDETIEISKTCNGNSNPEKLCYNNKEIHASFSNIRNDFQGGGKSFDDDSNAYIGRGISDDTTCVKSQNGYMTCYDHKEESSSYNVKNNKEVKIEKEESSCLSFDNNQCAEPINKHTKQTGEMGHENTHNQDDVNEPEINEAVLHDHLYYKPDSRNASSVEKNHYKSLPSVTENALQKHKKMLLIPVNQLKSCLNSFVTLKCELCETILPQGIEFIKHMEKHQVSNFSIKVNVKNRRIEVPNAPKKENNEKKDENDASDEKEDGFVACEPVICVVCNAQYINEEKLKSHMQDNHKALKKYGEYFYQYVQGVDEYYVCVICSSKISNDDIRMHTLSCKRSKNVTLYPIQINGKWHGQCSSKDILPTEKYPLHHSNLSGSRPLNCIACDFVSISKRTMDTHMADVHNLSLYVCDRCGKRFGSDYLRKLHIKKVHDYQQTCVCDECGKKFDSDFQLKKHINKGHDYQRIHCDQCCKTFLKRCQYDQHYKVEHEGYRFKCSYCHKEFKDPGSLKKHEKVHKGIIDYYCIACQKVFLKVSNYIYHMEKRHDIGKDFAIELNKNVKGIRDKLCPNRCDICNEVFPLDSAYFQHMFSEHKIIKTEVLKKRQDIIGIRKAENYQREIDEGNVVEIETQVEVNCDSTPVNQRLNTQEKHLQTAIDSATDVKITV